LGVAFAVLIAVLVGIGQSGLRRLKEIDESLSDITGRRSDKLQLSREALRLSNRNSRITMEIFLVQDRAQTNVLLATRAENTKKISALMAEITIRCESEKEKQRLSAVESTRKPYIDSYLRALHLLVDERERDAAVAVMVNETLPALVKYHAAWEEFVDFQRDQMTIATKQAEVDYAKARRLAYLLIVLAVIVAVGIAVFTTRHAQKSDQQLGMQYQLLFDNNPLPMWVFERKTLKFLAVNEAASRQYGFSRCEFLTMTIADIRPEEDIPALMKATAKPIRGFQKPTIWRHRKKDGAIIDVEIVGHDLQFQGVEAELVAARDVTERKRTAETAQRLAAIVEFSEDAIIGKNVDGVITSWNRAAEKMYGYTAAEVVGRDLFLILPSERQAELRAIMGRVQNGLSVECLETQRLTKTGSVLDVSLTISPMKDANGLVTGASTIGRDITLRKRAEEQLKLQSAALEAAANGIVITDRQGAIVWANHAFTTMTGYSKKEMLGKNPRLLKSGEQPDSYYAELWSTISSGKVWQGELVNRRKDGTTYTEEMTITPVTQGVGNAADTYFIAIKQDITGRKRAEEELYGSRQMLQSILDAIPQRVFWKDRNCIYLGCNRALATDAGLDAAAAIIGKSDCDLSWSAMAEHYRADDQLVMEQDSDKLNFQEQLSRPDGSMRWVQTNKLPLRDRKGKVTGVIGTYEDITERKLAEERVQFLAYYDALTGLPNRTLLQDRLAKALAGARRRKDKVAVLFLDLDRFKNINDSLGHSVGDLLLQKVSERLKRWAREQDTVARVGGDEFLIVLSAVKDVADAAVAAGRIRDAMTSEFVIQGRSLSVRCSLGISIFPDHGLDAESLIKNADAAMYSAKEGGRNKFSFFTQDMNAQAVERLTLENSLRSALEKGELFLVYQPQMEISTASIIGLEALLRWQHPDLGLVPPDKFIRIAENSGLIMPIGEWVLRTACSQARKWQDEGLPSVSVAVNVSAVQFRQEGFCELIRRVLRETGLAPQYLELELTESLLLSNADVMFSVLQELRAMGLKLAIDDFGTGYSSLSYLRQFPVSKLKIDRSFIRDVAVNPDDAAITTAIISMAKSLNLRVIAEGVEDEAQMSFLRAHQCDEIQGYYFSKPLAVDKVADKLRGNYAEHVRAQASGGQS
jgi:diguanylate cyclase (GGDEF)-like protein/PAS domain S-box-containing protein